MKKLCFYKLYDWMLDELGGSSDAVIIAVIYSFNENGLDCKISYSQFAELLKVSRRQAIDRIHSLVRDGYITVRKIDRQTNTYFVVRSSFGSFPSEENFTTSSESLVKKTSLPLVKKTSLPSEENFTTPSEENFTTPSEENFTQIENIKENKKRDNRECEREPAAPVSPSPAFSADADSVSFFGSAANVPLTAAQYQHLRYGMKYGKGKHLDTYIQIASANLANGKRYKDVYAFLLKMIFQDGGRELDQEEQMRNADYSDLFSGLL